VPLRPEDLEGMIPRGEVGPGALLRVPVITDDEWWTVDDFRVFHRNSPAARDDGRTHRVEVRAWGG